jgi:hypothetical protein
MACHFRANSFTLGICLYIFPSHVCHPLPPFLLRTPPLYFTIHLAGVSLGFGRSDNGLRMWLVPGVPSPSQPPCGSFIYNGPALCPLSVSLLSLFRLSCRLATQFLLLRIGSLGAAPFYSTYICPSTLVCFPLHLSFITV